MGVRAALIIGAARDMIRPEIGVGLSGNTQTANVQRQRNVQRREQLCLCLFARLLIYCFPSDIKGIVNFAIRGCLIHTALSWLVSPRSTNKRAAVSMAPDSYLHRTFFHALTFSLMAHIAFGLRHGCTLYQRLQGISEVDFGAECSPFTRLNCLTMQV